MTHDEWQSQVVQTAGYIGWRHLHVRKSIGKGKRWTTATNVVGWPDLLFWNERRPGFAAVEVKVPGDYPTPEQVDVLASLHRAGALVAIAYPADLDDLVAMFQHGTEFPAYTGRLRQSC